MTSVALFDTRLAVEEAVHHHGPQHGQVTVIAHSMGNNIFRYFLQWLEHEKGKNHYKKWIDTHIRAYVAIAPPFLGSAEPVESVLTGLPSGLPLPVHEARALQGSFGT